MKLRVSISLRAASDIRKQYDWIAARSITAAERWYERTLSALRTLETMPLRGRVAPESPSGGKEVRQIFVGRGKRRFRIVYQIGPKEVAVLHVRHWAQGPIRFDQSG